MSDYIYYPPGTERQKALATSKDNDDMSDFIYYSPDEIKRQFKVDPAKLPVGRTVPSGGAILHEGQYTEDEEAETPMLEFAPETHNLWGAAKHTGMELAETVGGHLPAGIAMMMGEQQQAGPLPPSSEFDGPQPQPTRLQALQGAHGLNEPVPRETFKPMTGPQIQPGYMRRAKRFLEQLGKENIEFYEDLKKQSPDVQDYLAAVTADNESYITKVVGSLGPTVGSLVLHSVLPGLGIPAFLSLNTKEIYDEAIKKGANPAAAQRLSEKWGVVNTLLDQTGLSTISRAFKPAGALQKWLVNFAIADATEAGTEATQELVTALASEWAAKAKSETPEQFAKRMWDKKDEILSRMGDAAAIAAGTTLLMGAPSGYFALKESAAESKSEQLLAQVEALKKAIQQPGKPVKIEEPPPKEEMPPLKEFAKLPGEGAPLNVQPEEQHQAGQIIPPQIFGQGPRKAIDLMRLQGVQPNAMADQIAREAIEGIPGANDKLMEPVVEGIAKRTIAGIPDAMGMPQEAMQQAFSPVMQAPPTMGARPQSGKTRAIDLLSRQIRGKEFTFMDSLSPYRQGYGITEGESQIQPPVTPDVMGEVPVLPATALQAPVAPEMSGDYGLVEDIPAQSPAKEPYTPSNVIEKPEPTPYMGPNPAMHALKTALAGKVSRVKEKEPEKKEELSPWDTTTTDMPYYDNILKNPEYHEKNKGVKGEVKWMTPDEYLEAQAKEKNVNLHRDLSHVDDDRVNEYAEKMKAGAKFPMLSIEVGTGNQEGKHRALAAKKAGVTSVPVFMVEKIQKEEAKTKEPWEMTLVEYARDDLKSRRHAYYNSQTIDSLTSDDQVKSFRAQYIKDLKGWEREGKKIPDDIKAKYPELREEEPRTTAIKPKAEESLEELIHNNKEKALQELNSKGQVRVGNKTVSLVDNGKMGWSVRIRDGLTGIEHELGGGYPAAWTREQAITRGVRDLQSTDLSLPINADNKPAEKPTEAQKEAGNYKKEHDRYRGLDISIETKKGQERTAKDGKAWKVTMPADYGYIRRTEGTDGEQVDVYLGDNPEAENVYIISQLNAETGRFDEYKSMIGFNSEEEARATYIKGFSDGKGEKRIGKIDEIPFEVFKQRLKAGHFGKKPRARAIEKPIPKDVQESFDYLREHGKLRDSSIVMGHLSHIMEPDRATRKHISNVSAALDGEITEDQIPDDIIDWFSDIPNIKRANPERLKGKWNKILYGEGKEEPTKSVKTQFEEASLEQKTEWVKKAGFVDADGNIKPLGNIIARKTTWDTLSMETRDKLSAVISGKPVEKQAPEAKKEAPEGEYESLAKAYIEQLQQGPRRVYGRKYDAWVRAGRPEGKQPYSIKGLGDAEGAVIRAEIDDLHMPRVKATRQEAIDDIVKAEAQDRKNRSRSGPVKRDQVKGSDGNWYSELHWPRGVNKTSERREFWVIESDGATVGKRYDTKEELEAAMEQASKATSEDYRSRLGEKSDDQLIKQGVYYAQKRFEIVKEEAPKPPAKTGRIFQLGDYVVPTKESGLGPGSAGKVRWHDIHSDGMQYIKTTTSGNLRFKASDFELGTPPTETKEPETPKKVKVKAKVEGTKETVDVAISAEEARKEAKDLETKIKRLKDVIECLRS